MLRGRAERGSQKWLQRFVAEAPAALQPRGLPPLDWISPLAADGYAEYMDGAFLDKLDLARLKPALAEFWPRSGPRWDGLAVFDDGVVLVEAKAHTDEFLTTSSKATDPASVAMIAAALSACRSALGADDRSDWVRCYYQYANRLAHLWWLRGQGVPAHLLFVHFVGDAERKGPDSPREWEVAERAAHYALGLKPGHPLARWVHVLHPDVPPD